MCKKRPETGVRPLSFLRRRGRFQRVPGKFHSAVRRFGLISPRVGKEKQSHHRRQSAARRHFVGRQQRRNQMARRHAGRRSGRAALRFLFAGLILLAVLRFTNWLGEFQPLRPAYTETNMAARRFESGGLHRRVSAGRCDLRPASHVALYLGASPVWALLGRSVRSGIWSSAAALRARRCWPWRACWCCSGRPCMPAKIQSARRTVRRGCQLCSGPITAARSVLEPQNQGRGSRRPFDVDVRRLAAAVGLVEIAAGRRAWTRRISGVQSLCIVFGSVVPYSLWNYALRHWRASQVMLFNNLIPLSTTAWVHFTLRRTHHVHVLRGDDFDCCRRR